MGFFDTILELTEYPETTAILNNDSPITPDRQGRKIKKTGKNQKKPEKLSFLRPCPVCAGRDFIYGTNGGFFCVVCQPGIVGHPITAAGPERQRPDEGHEEEEGADLEGSSSPLAPSRMDRCERKNLDAAWPILKEMMPALLAAGWTRGALLSRDYRKTQGIAWFPVWRRPGLTVTIGTQGQLVFSFRSGNQDVQQTGWPETSFFQHPKKF